MAAAYKSIDPYLSLAEGWRQNMERSLDQDVFKGRLKDFGGAKWSK